MIVIVFIFRNHWNDLGLQLRYHICAPILQMRYNCFKLFFFSVSCRRFILMMQTCWLLFVVLIDCGFVYKMFWNERRIVWGKRIRIMNYGVLAFLCFCIEVYIVLDLGLRSLINTNNGRYFSSYPVIKLWPWSFGRQELLINTLVLATLILW